MNDFNIYARIQQPESLLGRIGAGIGKWFGGSKEAPVVHLVGSTGAAELYTKIIGEGQFAENAQQLQEMLRNRQFVPIPTKKISFPYEAARLKPQEVVFVKISDIANMGLETTDIAWAVIQGSTPEITINQVASEVADTLRQKLFFDKIKTTLIEKWSQPVRSDLVERAGRLVSEWPKIPLKECSPLAVARTSGSKTIESNPKKLQDWMDGEQFIRGKAEKGEDLTLDDICLLNRKLNGSDNEEIGGGKLRNVPVLRGNRIGLHYVGKEEVRPLMEDLVTSMRVGIQKGENPVILAATIYQKMISVHPFVDGNGRTCRLVMDYILMRAGLPPPSLQGEEVYLAIFGDQYDARDMPAVETPTTAVEKVMAGIQRSFDVLNFKVL